MQHASYGITQNAINAFKRLPGQITCSLVSYRPLATQPRRRKGCPIDAQHARSHRLSTLRRWTPCSSTGTGNTQRQPLRGRESQQTADDAASHLTNAATCKMELGLIPRRLEAGRCRHRAQTASPRAHVTSGVSPPRAEEAREGRQGVQSRRRRRDGRLRRRRVAGARAVADRRRTAATGRRSRGARAARRPTWPWSSPRRPSAKASKEAERWVDKGVPQDVLAQAPGAVEHRTGQDDVDDAIATAYLLVNTNRLLDQAIAAFDDLLSKHPRLVAARLGRVSRLQDDLQGALEDFDVAVEVAPHVTDCLKRRGQSLAALGRLNDALRDLNAGRGTRRERFFK